MAFGHWGGGHCCRWGIIHHRSQIDCEACKCLKNSSILFCNTCTKGQTTQLLGLFNNCVAIVSDL